MRGPLAAVALCLATTGCAVFPSGPPAAPQPAKPVALNFFTGRWYEIARTPISLTTNCVAGTTDFITSGSGQLIERDECRKGAPEGQVQSFQGPIDVLNPGENSKFTVHYVLLGIIPFQQTYWILDHADDYAWFIVSDPSFNHVDILARAPRSSPATVAALTAKVRALGYDTSKLEFPATFPPGAG
jgi:apolipoprotein D and lipocalin family protein